MGRYDFEFGWNEPGAPPRETPTYQASMETLETQNTNLDISVCMGRTVCSTCGRFHGYCSEVKEQLTGIKATAATDRDGDITTAPGVPYRSWWGQDTTMDLGNHYDKDRKGGQGTPFLKAKDVPTKGCNAKIVGFREAPKTMEYSDFLLDLTIGSKQFTWGLKSKSVTLNMLIDELGKRTEKWEGKTIKLVRAGNKGQYINLG